ncbi:hypothetical protein [Flavobacterium sp.]|jgi:hypothetical protein|uniref:hypothetical protein n=1 Tax=Flavobacterium sp. TaxID=239 RepID=UPI0037BE3C19
MATVYVTKELKDRVRNNINTMRVAEINSDLPGYDREHLINASHIYHLGCWGKEHMHLLNVIPKDWLACNESVNTNVTAPHIDANGKIGELVFSVKFRSKDSFYSRPSDNYWNHVKSNVTLEEVTALPEDTPGRAEVLQRYEDEKVLIGINSRWETVHNNIMEFLDKCKSLNEAVKLFPTITMYLHQDDISRLNRKVERTAQRKAIVLDVDVEGITAAAIAAKLTASL